MGFLNRGSFIIHALLPGTSKVFTIVSFPAGCTCACPSAGHTIICCEVLSRRAVLVKPQDRFGRFVKLFS